MCHYFHHFRRRQKSFVSLFISFMVNRTQIDPPSDSALWHFFCCPLDLEQGPPNRGPQARSGITKKATWAQRFQHCSRLSFHLIVPRPQTGQPLPPGNWGTEASGAMDSRSSCPAQGCGTIKQEERWVQHRKCRAWTAFSLCSSLETADFLEQGWANFQL